MTPALLKAQDNTVQIVDADNIIGGMVNGVQVQKILGGVHLRTKKMDMYADSAYKFSVANIVKAFGNIEIDMKTKSIFADTLTYYTATDLCALRGRVIIKSDSSTLFGSKVDYDMGNEIGHFLNGIRLKDPHGILTADKGYFYRKADSAVFRGNVQLKDSLKYLEGDSLFSNRRSGYYELYGHIYGYDPANNSKISGDYLQADSSGKRIVRGHAWLINYKGKPNKKKDDGSEPDSLLQKKNIPDATAPDSLPSLPRDSGRVAPGDTAQTPQPDTTHIFAYKIVSIANRTPNDTTTIVKATKQVRVWSTNFSAVSDTARYNSKTHTFKLHSNAKSWHNNIQLTGPYIQVNLQNGEIKKLISYPGPFVVQQDTSIDRLNQIKGDSLTSLFDEGRLKLIQVTGNSKLLRFTKKGDTPDGLIVIQSPLIDILFQNGELTRMKALKNTGHYLPQSKKTAEKKLEGFAWNPDLRPQKPDKKMQRRLPPISLNPPFKLPERYLKYIHQSRLPDSLQASTKMERSEKKNSTGKNNQQTKNAVTSKKKGKNYPNSYFRYFPIGYKSIDNEDLLIQPFLKNETHLRTLLVPFRHGSAVKHGR